jgi:mRNA-degrading endonuclease YafQ of YafQ-DinJ toxin-antitoxin module
MKYRYRAAEPFWTRFYRLSSSQKDSTRKAWQIFKTDPFDPRLRTHKIQRLSALYARTIYAADIEGDLRAVFYLDGDVVVTLDIGTHAIYER